MDETFTFKGAGNAFNGIAKRMELWIDGKKIGAEFRGPAERHHDLNQRDAHGVVCGGRQL